MKVLSIMAALAIMLTSSSFMNAPTKTTADNVHFESLTLSQAMEKAKKENKYIFLNIYAVWCRPCMMLKQNTFTSESVTKALNKSFVNLDVDAEKGEGISISKKYAVRAHPLMLILDSQGKEVKRILGYRNDAQLLADVKPYLK